MSLKILITLMLTGMGGDSSSGAGAAYACRTLTHTTIRAHTNHFVEIICVVNKIQFKHNVKLCWFYEIQWSVMSNIIM